MRSLSTQWNRLSKYQKFLKLVGFGFCVFFLIAFFQNCTQGFSTTAVGEAKLSSESVPYTSDLNQVLASTPNAPIDFQINTPMVLSNDLTIGPNISLRILAGGSIDLNNKNLKIQGNFEAGFYQIFFNYQVGSVQFSGPSVKEVYPQWWGPDSTGAVDASSVQKTTLSLQSAHAAKKNVFYPSGTYVINQSIQLYPGAKVYGESNANTILVNIAPDQFLFEYQSALTNEAYDLDATFDIESLKIYATNGIKINQSGDYKSVFARQSAIRGLILRDLWMTGTIKDPKSGTAEIPSQSELEKFGVGFRAAKIMDSEISDCQFQNFGIGILLDGSDINEIRNNRFAGNDRHFHYFGHDTWGGQSKLLNNDILANGRWGGVFLDGTIFAQIEGNYFETYTLAATQIASKNDMGTLISQNRFDDNHQAGIPIISLDPAYGIIVSENRFTPYSPNPIFEVKHNFWTVGGATSILGQVVNNEGTFPLPTSPMVNVGSQNPLLFSAMNVNSWSIQGTAATQWPWITSPITGRAVLQTNVATAFLQFDLKSGFSVYKIRAVGRKVTGAGYIAIVQIQPDGTRLELFRDFLGFSKSEVSEVIEKQISIPPGAPRNGALNIELVNTEVEYETIELVPVN